MLDRESHSSPGTAAPLRERFLRSSSRALGELKQLLMESPQPIEPSTGAQVAQMLRAIREGAAAHGLDRVARAAAPIEMYLTSSEAYGPGGELRNQVLASQIAELQKRFSEPSAGVLPRDMEWRSTATPASRVEAR
jgi:hypothetical protein